MHADQTLDEFVQCVIYMKLLVTLFKASKPLPILNLSNFVPENEVPVVNALILFTPLGARDLQR